MPRGLYWLSHSQVKNGDLVAVCLPENLGDYALQRGYLHHGSCSNGVEPLFKKVVGIGSDLIELTPADVIVNGIALPHSMTLVHDRLNRSLTFIKRGKFILSTNSVWLFGTSDPLSWDSRYFGAVSTADIIGVIHPLFVLHSGGEYEN